MRSKSGEGPQLARETVTPHPALRADLSQGRGEPPTMHGIYLITFSFCAVTSRSREENNSLHAICDLKETTCAMPAPKCGHRYFSGVLDSFIGRPHHPDVA
ncbi:hypothetical protein [Bradyrhizobium sp. ORS 111]|uniref:hypothetical protein n=1 Tax=Bradyrhizobium sp. ORS 111 TaxID=1685958 RepID=UPI00388D333B